MERKTSRQTAAGPFAKDRGGEGSAPRLGVSQWQGQVASQPQEGEPSRGCLSLGSNMGFPLLPRKQAFPAMLSRQAVLLPKMELPPAPAGNKGSDICLNDNWPSGPASLTVRLEEPRPGRISSKGRRAIAGWNPRPIAGPGVGDWSLSAP